MVIIINGKICSFKKSMWQEYLVTSQNNKSILINITILHLLCDIRKCIVINLDRGNTTSVQWPRFINVEVNKLFICVHSAVTNFTGCSLTCFNYKSNSTLKWIHTTKMLSWIPPQHLSLCC